MQSPVTIDAQVFLNAFTPSGDNHPDCYRLIKYLRMSSTSIFCPILFLPEIAALISQGTNNPDLAKHFSNALLQLPQLVLVQVDSALAEEAMTIAVSSCLRGSDAINAAVARRFASTLITLDTELHNCFVPQVTILYPDEALVELGVK